MVLRGGIVREEARNHPDKNIITRAVGAEDTVQADFFTVHLQEGDTILMCTDGLTNMLDDQEIFWILSGTKDLAQGVGQLVAAANRNGGKDNISVIIIDPFADEVKEC